MSVPKVLAVSAAILGAFLLFSLLSGLFPSSPPCDHNIACYLLPLPLNHSGKMQDRLTHIQGNLSTSSSQLAHHYHSLIHNHSAFSQHALTLAKNFDTYLQHLTQQLALRHKDHEVVLAVKEAEQQFLLCKQQIEANSSQECAHTWNSYLQCFEQVKGVKDHLQTLLATQKELQKRIAATIEQPKQDDPEKRPEFVAQQIYNESMLQNENTLRELRIKIESSQLRLNLISEQRDKCSQRAQLKQHAYRECWQNRRIHRHCEEISEQVKNISTGTLQQLRQQIEAKNRLMQEMREMMLRMGKGDNRKMPEHWNQMYKEHLQEYKQMLKDYIYNTQMERKACGCSEQEEKTLLQELEGQKKAIVEAQLEISSLTRDISFLKTSIVQKQQEKAKIIADYQKALRQYQTDAPQFRQSQLIRLKKQLDRNRANLLRLQADYNSINHSCNNIKTGLTATLKDINKAEECLAKKDYLLKLRSQTAQYLKPERSLVKLHESKHKLAQALRAFQP